MLAEDRDRSEQVLRLKRLYYQTSGAAARTPDALGLTRDVPLCRWSFSVLPGTQRSMTVSTSLYMHLFEQLDLRRGERRGGGQALQAWRRGRPAGHRARKVALAALLRRARRDLHRQIQVGTPPRDVRRGIRPGRRPREVHGGPGQTAGALIVCLSRARFRGFRGFRGFGSARVRRSVVRVSPLALARRFARAAAGEPILLLLHQHGVPVLDGVIRPPAHHLGELRPLVSVLLVSVP